MKFFEYNLIIYKVELVAFVIILFYLKDIIKWKNLLVCSTEKGDVLKIVIFILRFLK